MLSGKLSRHRPEDMPGIPIAAAEQLTGARTACPRHVGWYMCGGCDHWEPWRESPWTGRHPPQDPELPRDGITLKQASVQPASWGAPRARSGDLAVLIKTTSSSDPRCRLGPRCGSIAHLGGPLPSRVMSCTAGYGASFISLPLPLFSYPLGFPGVSDSLETQPRSRP